MKRFAWVLLAVPVLMATRPGNEQQLVQQLNGQPSRFNMIDGGNSIVYVASGSTACMPITGAYTYGTPMMQWDAGVSVNNPRDVNVLMFVPPVPVLVCIRPSTLAPRWDGGCNHFPGDENMGVPLPAGVPQYITPDSAARSLCVVQDAGAIAMPVWTVQ